MVPLAITLVCCKPRIWIHESSVRGYTGHKGLMPGVDVERAIGSLRQHLRQSIEAELGDIESRSVEQLYYGVCYAFAHTMRGFTELLTLFYPGSRNPKVSSTNPPAYVAPVALPPACCLVCELQSPPRLIH